MQDSFASFDIQANAWNTIAEAYNQLQTSGVKTIDELKTMNQLLYKSAKSDLNNKKVSTMYNNLMNKVLKNIKQWFFINALCLCSAWIREKTNSELTSS